MANHKLYVGDALEVLKTLPDESVDCVITDPPYNISQEGKKLARKNLSSKQHKRNSDILLDFGEWDRKSEKKYYEFTENWFKEVVRILKPKKWFATFFSKERIGYFSCPLNGFFKKYGFKTRTIIAWHKTNPSPSFRKMNFLSSTEFIVVGSKGKSKIPNFLEQKYMHNFFETPNSSSYQQTIHPTEKPESLISWLVKILSNQQEIILDPFAGSGTTMIVAEKLGRNSIGIELNPKYTELIKKRFEPYLKQAKLIGETKLEVIENEGERYIL